MKSIEQWKPIAGFEGLYEVSSFGRVKSLANDKSRKEKILKPKKRKDGYLQVNLYKDRKMKSFKIHRLVAIAFIPNPMGLPEINHKDENPSNNVVDNIEWTSRWDNMHYGTLYERASASKSKAVEASKYPDFRTIELRFASTKEAEMNGYSSGGVSACCRKCFNREGNNKYRNLYWRYAV